jgi:hypothetical protein
MSVVTFLINFFIAQLMKLLQSKKVMKISTVEQNLRCIDICINKYTKTSKIFEVKITNFGMD